MTGKNKMEELLYLQITSGRGPVECCRIVVLVVKELVDDAACSGVKAEVCCYNDGPSQGTWSSATVKLSGQRRTLLPINGAAAYNGWRKAFIVRIMAARTGLWVFPG